MRETPSFSEVYDEFVSVVYSYLAYHVRDRTVAEDLTQSTFERALRAWARYDPARGPVRPWLLAIARNQLIDFRRRPMASPMGLIAEEELTAAPAEGDSGFDAPLVEAIWRLSERERSAIALRYVGDLSVGEIAAELETSVGNVHQLLSRSLRRLRRDLEGDV